MDRLVSILLVLSMLGACNSVSDARLTVSGLAFFNAGNTTIEKVTLRVVESGKMVSCTQVETKRYCGTGFPQTHYQNAELSLSWQNQDGTQITRAVNLIKPELVDPNLSYVAVIKFNNSSSFEAFFTENPRPF